MRPLLSPTSARQRGVSLVEILIGVTIGVIGILAIFQTVAVWNKHAQTTTSGGDAQIAGTLALFNIERDLKQAGHGFGRAPLQVMGCGVQADDVTRAPTAFNFTLQPINIVPGPGGAPDTITTLYGDSSFFVDQEDFTASSTVSKTLRRRGGFHPGDLAIVAGNATALPASATCQLIEITGEGNLDGRTVDHGNAAYLSYYDGAGWIPRFNPPGGTNPAFGTGSVYNLGRRPQLSTWQIVNSRTLVRNELFAPPPTPMQIADGVVSIKAQYGVDADNDGRVDNTEWTTAAPVGDWTKLLAVRVAVLVRSRSFERSGDPSANAAAAVTVGTPTWAGSVLSPFVMTNVDGTPDAFGPTNPDPNNWRFYRYRVYERVILLRNMVWGTLG
jgi:type IV pilus assembly protein PilW